MDQISRLPIEEKITLYVICYSTYLLEKGNYRIVFSQKKMVKNVVGVTETENSIVCTLNFMSNW